MIFRNARNAIQTVSIIPSMMVLGACNVSFSSDSSKFTLDGVCNAQNVCTFDQTGSIAPGDKSVVRLNSFCPGKDVRILKSSSSRGKGNSLHVEFECVTPAASLSATSSDTAAASVTPAAK